MGKGTRKRTVWRTFSFENGNCNENDASPANQNNNGQESIPTSNDTNVKPVSNWRYRRYHSNGTENLSSENESHDDDTQKSKELSVEEINNTSGYHDYNYGYRHQYKYHHHYNRPYFKRWPLSDQQYARNGFRKNVNSCTENGGNHGENDDNINNEDDSNRIQSNHYTRSYRTPFHRHFNGGYRRWENRYYHPNSSIGNYYNRGFRRSYFSHSDKQYPAFTKNNNHYYNKNCLTENGINTHDRDKPNDGSFGHQNGKQDSIKINEDEYTRISTPRSEVLFKKGYLMRAKKYAESTTPPTTAATASINLPTSSNDSGSVSVVSNEETASYYSIHSMSPENSAFVNANICNDSTSISYPNENYNGDVPLIFSSGFYDNNGYFFVNPYIPSHYDQYNRPIGLIPFDNATPANRPCPASSATIINAKSITDDHLNDFNNQHSINSEDISNSSLSENASINNDSVAPQSPLTLPPSPLSPSDQNLSNDNTNKCVTNTNETTTNVDEPALASATDTNGEKNLNKNNDKEMEPNPAEDMQNQSNEADVIEPSEDNYSMPYYPPFIFVPPIPFVPGGHMPYQKRNRYHRRYSYHRHNHFRKYNRFYQYNDKFYVPTNWSEAPDETTVNVVQDNSATSDAEPATDVEKSNDIIASPTLEQCDIILKNSKLNSNVSEFVPQTKRNAVILVNQMVPSPINIQPSQLNVNVPEFLPRNYKPLAQFQLNDDISNTIPKCDKIEDNKSNSIADKTFDQSAVESKENDENQKLDKITNSTKLDNDSQNEQVQKSITNCATNGSKDGVEYYNKNIPSTVRTLSELLKTNSNTKTLITNENSFVDPSELNKSISDTGSSIEQQNSRMNLKADLGNKHRNKVWYNRNSSADYKNNYNTNNDLNINTNRNNNYDKTMNNNNNNNSRMIKIAYPAINGHHQHHAKLTDMNHSYNNSSTAIAIPTKDIGRNVTKLLSNKGFSYAQMVVPTKSESIQSANNRTPLKLKPAKKFTNVTNNKTNLKPTKTEENPSIQMKQKNNGSVEWFTVGAKGKKQVLLNDKPNFVEFTTKLLQENTSTEEQVNSVAEELQLDIKNDSDLAMDIMDSLALSKTKTATNQALNAGKKKASITKTLKKKSPKDKMIKESKRSRSQTFEIIEPNFQNESKQITIFGDVQATKSNENGAIDENSQINDDEEFTFDPNVFTAPLNFKTDITPENVPNVRNSCTALRLSANKSIRSLMNTFDIYQSDLNMSAENQKLQKAEEMVNKVLESLKKIETNGDVCALDETISTDLSDAMQQIQPNNEITSDDDDDEVNSSHSSASSISFEVNAKPYQNAYSSNHFLGHFFGDKNDKRDQVVHSANLSSSDQNSCTNTNAEQLNEFDVSNNKSILNITDVVIVKNVENINSELCDIMNVVSQHESSSSKSENLILNNESDYKQAPEAFDDLRIKPRVDLKLNENDTDIATDTIHSEKITQLKFSQKSAHSINDSPSNDEIDKPVVVIKNIKPVFEQKKFTSIDSMVETDETVQNEPRTETKPNHQIPNKQRPWLCIVDTQMLEMQKKMQNTFPITAAVSMWLNQAQKEKTPEPILRLPNDLHGNGFFGAKRTKTISQTSQSTATTAGTDQYYHLDNYSSDETASLTSERDEKDKIDLTSIVDDDEEEDIMNYWELDSQSMLTPQTTPAYQSVYGNSINYEKILSNKNELLCNNIIDFDHVEEMAGTYPQTKATVNTQGPQTKLGTDEDYFKPAPEVCCTIM